MSQRHSPGASSVSRRHGDARTAAAGTIAAVLGGRSLATALPPALERTAPEERARAQNLCYGTLRWTPQLRSILGRLQKRPLRARDRILECVLLMGLFELMHGRTPEHAAVSETIDCARRLGINDRALGFVNAVLRRFLRERGMLQAELADDPVGLHAHPPWLLRQIQQEWPDDWTGIMAANNAPAPMALRVALDRISRRELQAMLAERGIAARPHERVPSALVLEAPQAVKELPGFADGLCSVQDPAAQLAATLLDLGPGMRVLDACAAPGGKSGHILESEGQLEELVAVDIDRERLLRVEDNLQRLQRRARVLEADLREPARWWDGQAFDRILLDAPCSGSGVIRRHPDIKLLRRPEDSKTLAASQRRLLNAAWRILAPGGKIIYATCSIFGDENQGVIGGFMTQQDDAECLQLPGTWGRARGPGRQILPGDDGMDGFFFAGLRKRPA